MYIIILYVSDIDECNSQICGVNSECVNTPGSYQCRCISGFTWSGTACVGKWLLHQNSAGVPGVLPGVVQRVLLTGYCIISVQVCEWF